MRCLTNYVCYYALLAVHGRSVAMKLYLTVLKRNQILAKNLLHFDFKV